MRVLRKLPEDGASRWFVAAHSRLAPRYAAPGRMQVRHIVLAWPMACAYRPKKGPADYGCLRRMMSTVPMPREVGSPRENACNKRRHSSPAVSKPLLRLDGPHVPLKTLLQLHWQRLPAVCVIACQAVLPAFGIKAEHCRSYGPD